MDHRSPHTNPYSLPLPPPPLHPSQQQHSLHHPSPTSHHPWPTGLPQSLSNNGWSPVNHNNSGPSPSSVLSGGDIGINSLPNTLNDNSLMDYDDDGDDFLDELEGDNGIGVSGGVGGGQGGSGGVGASGSGSGTGGTTTGPDGEVKKKSTRGSRACQVCRRLKVRLLLRRERASRVSAWLLLLTELLWHCLNR